MYAEPQTRRDRTRVAILNARLARIENRPADWDRHAREALLTADADDYLLATMLQAGAAKRLGRHEEAGHLRAEVDRRTSTEIAGNGFACYLLAVDAWEDADYDRARTVIDRNLKAGAHVNESNALLGWIAVKRERYAEAAHHFRTALEAARSAATPDRLLEANAMHALAAIASEIIDLQLGRFAAAAYNDIPWTPALSVFRFNALTSLRYLALLEGDRERAWLLSRESIAVAPSPAYAAIGEIYGSVSSTLIGDQNAARLQFRRAWDILKSQQWSAIETEARGALTSFVIEAATTMPAEARKAATLYRSLRARENVLSSVNNDRRITAVELEAAARIRETMGATQPAIARYRMALDLWSELGCTMRAALVALDLLRLTGDRSYRAPVKAALTLAPKAWFALPPCHPELVEGPLQPHALAPPAPQPPKRRSTPKHRHKIPSDVAPKPTPPTPQKSRKRKR